MLKNQILEYYQKDTGKIFREQSVHVGDIVVWDNIPQLAGIVGINSSQPLKENDIPLTLQTNDKQFYSFPPEENSEFFKTARIIGNVGASEPVMEEAIKQGLVEEQAAKAKKSKKVEEPKKAEEPTKSKPLSLEQKINAIRLAWRQIKVEKEGHGKAGGGATYDYYTPEQITSFTLEQEAKYNLFSNTLILGSNVFYRVMDLDNPDKVIDVNCPFEIPTKMAASQAQQIGAAITYYERRLAMLLYKIQDNSKENVEVMGNADYTVSNEPIEIPTPPEPIVDTPAAPAIIDNGPKIEEPDIKPDVSTPLGLNNIPPINVEPKITTASAFSQIGDLY